MVGLIVSRNSKIAPNPDSVQHSIGFKAAVGYTCHMAAIHWAIMSWGADQAEANRAVSSYARSNCQRCTGKGAGHHSIPSHIYGTDFCMGAQEVTRKTLFDVVRVGDLLVTESPHRPMHSLILRQRRGADHVTVRGFNNFGTLGTGERDRYDDCSHNIAQEKYWDESGTLFGQIGVKLHVVPNEIFMAAAHRCWKASKLMGA